MIFTNWFGEDEVISSPVRWCQKLRLFLSWGMHPPDKSKITGQPVTIASVVKPAPGLARTHEEIFSSSTMEQASILGSAFMIRLDVDGIRLTLS